MPPLFPIALLPLPPPPAAPAMTLSLPNPAYLLFGLAWLWNCLCRSASPSDPASSGAVTELTMLPAVALSPPQKLLAVATAACRVPSSWTAAVTVDAAVESAPRPMLSPAMTDPATADVSMPPTPAP